MCETRVLSCTARTCAGAPRCPLGAWTLLRRGSLLSHVSKCSELQGRDSATTRTLATPLACVSRRRRGRRSRLHVVSAPGCVPGIKDSEEGQMVALNLISLSKTKCPLTLIRTAARKPGPFFEILGLLPEEAVRLSVSCKTFSVLRVTYTLPTNVAIEKWCSCFTNSCFETIRTSHVTIHARTGKKNPQTQKIIGPCLSQIVLVLRV